MKINEIIVEGHNFAGGYPSFHAGLGLELEEDYRNEHPWSDVPIYDKKDAKTIHKKLTPNWEKAGLNGKHVTSYTNDSTGINDKLHRLYRDPSMDPGKFYPQRIQAMDELISNHKTTEFIVVYTGLPMSPAVAYKTYGANPKKPIRLHLPAYTSTTTDIAVAVNHGWADEVNKDINARNYPNVPKEHRVGTQILKLEIPAGTPAISVAHLKDNAYQHEAEIILHRGMDIEVDPKPSVMTGRFMIASRVCWIWHARIIGHNPIAIKV